jgi:hypothetical protein
VKRKNSPPSDCRRRKRDFFCPKTLNRCVSLLTSQPRLAPLRGFTKMKLFCIVNKFLDYIVDCYFKRLLPGLMITDAPLLILVVLLLALVSKTFFFLCFSFTVSSNLIHMLVPGRAITLTLPNAKKDQRQHTSHRLLFSSAGKGLTWLGLTRFREEMSPRRCADGNEDAGIEHDV